MKKYTFHLTFIILFIFTGISAHSQEIWTATSTTNAPDGRMYHPVISTGNKMIIWGGYNYTGTALYTGGIYDTATNSWTTITTTNAPVGRYNHTAIWTGTVMIIWGGTASGGSTYLRDGYIFDTSNIWTPISITNAPTGRYVHTAIWAGSKMIVWGGVGAGIFNTGGIYNYAANTWDSTTVLNAPSARCNHTAVWTGSKMIIWGGWNSGYINTGGIYDPSTNTWSAISTVNAPSARRYHTAVWTGSKMVIWGGYDGTSLLNTGGIYDPITDSWTATSTVNVHPATESFTTIWTGTKMLVWGGNTWVGFLNTGKLFDVSTNSWADISSVNAPQARYRHSAVWTGSRMIVWGGWNGSSFVNSGGTYINPAVLPPPPAPTLISPLNGAVNILLTPVMTWNPSAGANTYRIQISTDSTFSSAAFDSSGITGTTVTVPSGKLNNNVLYYWHVNASNTGGAGSYTGTWSFTTIVPVPAAPTLVSPANNSVDLSVTPLLDWGDVQYASVYRVQVSANSGFTSVLYDTAGLGISQITVPQVKLTTNTLYYWRVNASNIAGTGSYSTIWNFTTAPNVPNIPVLISPLSGALNQPTAVTLIWHKAVETLIANKGKYIIAIKDGALTINKYWLEYSSDSTFVTKITDSTLTDTTKLISGLNNITKYYWRVKAKNQTGWGAFSDASNFTTIVPLPTAPVLNLPANNTTGIVLTPLLDWNDVQYAAGYMIQVSSDSTFSSMVYDTTNVTSSQITIPAGKLTGYTKYYWRVNASNAAGTGSWSSVWNFKTLQNLSLNLKVYLEGFWNGTAQVQDTVSIYLAGSNSPYAFSDSAKVFLSSSGSASIQFTNTQNANYYIVIKHRNHLETWSKLPVSFVTNVSVNYDFTTAASQAYGDNMKQAGSVWVLYGGDPNRDGSIDANDVPVFLSQFGMLGYLSADFNGDDSVDASDVPIFLSNFGLIKSVPGTLLQKRIGKQALPLNRNNFK